MYELDLRQFDFSHARLFGAAFVGCDLSGAIFDDATSRGAGMAAQLENASFRRVQFSEVRFAGAHARGCVFDGARLKKCDFEGTDLTGASFRDADLSGSRFRDADLSGSRFRDAHLAACDFRGANLKNAFFPRDLDKSTDLRGASLVDLYAFPTEGPIDWEPPASIWRRATVDETTVF